MQTQQLPNAPSDQCLSIWLEIETVNNNQDWDWFTDAVVRSITQELKKHGIVFDINFVKAQLITRVLH